MPSIKCPQCGLVNFSTALQCKRCQHPFSEFSPIAEQRPYQTNAQEVQSYQTQPFHQNQPTSFRAFQSPPPPPTFDHSYEQQSYEQPEMYCVKCGGGGHGVSMQNFKKEYVPPAAYLAFFCGLIPMLILVLVMRVTHHLSAPFCNECWINFRKVNTVETLTSLGCFALLIGGGVIASGAGNGAGFIFFVCLALAIGLIAWGQIFKKNNSPKFKKVSRNQVVIDDPTFGEVCFQR